MTRSSRRTTRTSTRPREASRAGDNDYRKTPVVSGPVRTLSRSDVTQALRRLLGAGDPRLLWRERGDELLIHAAEIEAKIAGDEILVTVPMETIETGRSALQVPFALAPSESEMVGLTTAVPSGPPILAGRWGPVVQNALFDALVQLTHEAAGKDRTRLHGIRIRRGRIELKLDT